MPSDGATAQASDAAMKISRPMTMGPLRPNLSVIGPHITCPSAKPSSEVLTVSCRLPMSVPKCSAIAGKPGR